MQLIYSILTTILLSVNISGGLPYAKIEQAFEANSAKSIVAMGKSKMLVNVLGTEGAYSPSQATLILKDFFSKNPGKDFEFVFKGKESGDGTFAIGNYLSNGSKFRITIHLQKLSDNYQIERLSIERD